MSNSNGSRKHIKLIATDIDGTLLNSHHELTPRTEKAIRRAMEKGIHVVLATGKTRGSAVKLIDLFGLTTPGVYVQGLAIYAGDGTISFQQTLEDDVVRQVVEYADTHDLQLLLYSESRIISQHPGRLADQVKRYHEPEVEVIGSFQPHLGTLKPNKIYFSDDPEKMTALRNALGSVIGSTATMVQPSPNMLEILPMGASKGAGLKRLLDMLDIQPENVLALGDGENDLEMIKLAGIGIAMGNAMSHLKEVADFVTATNDEDGVALAIEKFVLNDA